MALTLLRTLSYQFLMVMSSYYRYCMMLLPCSYCQIDYVLLIYVILLLSYNCILLIYYRQNLQQGHQVGISQRDVHFLEAMMLVFSILNIKVGIQLIIQIKTKQKMDMENSKTKESELYRLMLMMRQQIQISANTYKQKLNTHLKDQAQQLQKLRKRIRKNEEQLQIKNETIHKLQERQRQRERQWERQKERKHSKQKISITKTIKSSETNNVFQRITELQNKCTRYLQLEKGIREKYNELNTKIASIQTITIKVLNSKIKECEQRLNDYIQSRQSTMHRIIKDIQHIQPNNNNNNSISNSRAPHLHKTVSAPDLKNEHICMLRQQLQQLRQQFINYSSKQIKYDNYKLPQIVNQINKLKKNIQLMNNNNNKNNTNNSNNHNHSSSQYTMHNKSNHYNSNNNKQILKTTKFEEPQEPAQYENVQSQEQYTEQSLQYQQQEDEDDNIDRLNYVIFNQKLIIPITVEIDQTGYLKSTETGMYIVDDNNDGFELTEPEIKNLCSKGIIKLI